MKQPTSLHHADPISIYGRGNGRALRSIAILTRDQSAMIEQMAIEANTGTLWFVSYIVDSYIAQWKRNRQRAALRAHRRAAGRKRSFPRR
jgi:hypothetical protein